MKSLHIWLGRTFQAFIRTPKATRRKKNPRRGTPLLLEWLEDRTAPAVYLVTGTADGLGSVAPNGVNGIDFNATTLRAAIIAANAAAGSDTIQVPAGTYLLSLTGANEDAAASGDLDITDSVTIQGAAAATTLIDGNLTDRVFHVVGGTNTTLTLANLTIQNGRVTGSAAAGGGILAEAGFNVNVNNCTISSNEANSDISGSGTFAAGGGIAMRGGVLTITNSAITGNTAIGADGTSTVQANEARGGGIYSAGTAGDGLQNRVLILRSSISGNRANGGSFTNGRAFGGGLATDTDGTTITDSTFSGNSASVGNAAISDSAVVNGGGIASGIGPGSPADLTIANSTISTNEALIGFSFPAGTSGGGIGINTGSARITNTTITLNMANTGNGIAAAPGTSTLVGSTIIAQNGSGAGPADVDGSFTSLFHNLVGVAGTATGFTNNAANPGDATFEQVGTSSAPLDAGLLPLATYGAPILMHALSTTSLARDRGASTFAGLNGFIPPTFDERGAGFARTLGAQTDVGAFEAVKPVVYRVTGIADGLGSVTPNGAGGIDFDATTLRAAVIAANAASTGPDFSATIVLAAGTYVLTLVGANEDAAATGDLDITANVTIQGVTAATTIIDGNLTDRVLHVLGNASTTLTLNNVTVRNGRAPVSTNNNVTTAFGGGIRVDNGSTLNVINSAITDNQANGGVTGQFVGGGGISAEAGTVHITDSVVANNQATGSVFQVFGGGIYHDISTLTISTLTILRSTLSGNSAVGTGSITTVFGGGLAAEGTTTITDSAFIGNSASVGPEAQPTSTALGGGIAAGVSTGGIITIANSTISGNQANSSINGGTVKGGGFGVAKGLVVVTNTTITRNQANGGPGGHGNGGGFFAPSSTASNPGIPFVGSTIIAQNTSSSPADGPDISGFFNTLFHNLIGDSTGGFDILGFVNNSANPADATYEQVGTAQAPLNPGLLPLANNGGPTPTHALASTSPALDRGDAVFTGNPFGLVPPTFDQRGTGFPRTVGPRTDVGALESTRLVALSSATTPQSLVFFLKDAPGTPTATLPVTGLAQGENLLDVDVRPADQRLYAVSDRNRVYTIDTTTGAATLAANLSTGLNDDLARTLANSLGLYVDAGGTFEDAFPGFKWLRGANNAFGNPWYFINTQGDFSAWSGATTVGDAVTMPTGTRLASLGTDLYKNLERLYQASSVTLGAAEAAVAQTQDQTLGLYVDAQGFFQDGGNDVKYLRGADNTFGNPWYFLRPNGDFVAWNGRDSAGTPLATFAGTVFLHPELLVQASQETLTGQDLTQAQTFDQNLGLHVDAAGFFQASGSDVKWLRGNSDPVNTVNTILVNNPWYFIRPNGDLVAWSGSGLTGTVLHTFPSAVFRKPELLYQASSATLGAAEAAQAVAFDQSLGLHVDAGGFFQLGGDIGPSNPKYLRGALNANGNPWYLLRGNGDFVAWNGSDVNGAPLFTFNPAVFNNPELLYEAYQPPLSTATFGPGNVAAIDFGPVTDRLRIVTNNGQNLSVNLGTGLTAVNGALHYGTAAAPNIVAAAYTNNFVGATSTVLYDIDSGTDMLVTQSTATGLLTNVGPLGVDTSAATGFDIAASGDAFAILTSANAAHIFQINLTTGAATDLGVAVIGLYGLAVLP